MRRVHFLDDTSAFPRCRVNRDEPALMVAAVLSGASARALPDSCWNHVCYIHPVMNALALPMDRVRRHTDRTSLETIDAAIRTNVQTYGRGSPTEMSRRIGDLEREWDIERALETNASTVALAGAVLGTTVHKKWFWLTGGVLSFLLQHALSGWCPPLPFLRRLGIRTQSEIDLEKYALKAVRGDFDQQEKSRSNGLQALRAVSMQEKSGHPLDRRDPDRVRRFTSRTTLDELDHDMAARVRYYATESLQAISERIEVLRREWSIERYLQISIAAVGLGTVALATTRDRRWGLVTCAGVGAFLFHALKGFDPFLPALRRAGRRSRAEIDREIYALKLLRGDFDGIVSAKDRVEAALAAASS